MTAKTYHMLTHETNEWMFAQVNEDQTVSFFYTPKTVDPVKQPLLVTVPGKMPEDEAYLLAVAEAQKRWPQSAICGT